MTCSFAQSHEQLNGFVFEYFLTHTKHCTQHDQHVAEITKI